MNLKKLCTAYLFMSFFTLNSFSKCVDAEKVKLIDFKLTSVFNLGNGEISAVHFKCSYKKFDYVRINAFKEFANVVELDSLYEGWMNLFDLNQIDDNFQRFFSDKPIFIAKILKSLSSENFVKYIFKLGITPYLTKSSDDFIVFNVESIYDIRKQVFLNKLNHNSQSIFFNKINVNLNLLNGSITSIIFQYDDNPEYKVVIDNHQLSEVLNIR